jgi:hypothetical protein
MTSHMRGVAAPNSWSLPAQLASVNAELLFWRLANRIMMGVLGLAWFGPGGAAAGPILYWLLAFGPVLTKRFAPPFFAAVGVKLGAILGAIGGLFSHRSEGDRP